MHRTTSAGRRRRRGSSTGRVALSVLALTGASLLTFVVPQTAYGEPVANAADTGFALPFSGAPAYENAAPTQLTGPDQLNQPLGQARADDIAGRIGLRRDDVLTDQQYQDLTTGGGVGGSVENAQVIDACVDILTNTVGRPLHSDVGGRPTPSVLASYGLYVNPGGLLESPANADAPTRQVNTLIAPGGYVGNWLRDNGATRTLAALYRSAYTVQAAYGFAAQQISGRAQLVTNTKGDVGAVVGMSMAPPLWIVNFALIYIMKPTLAADMPAYWAPIPGPVVDAIDASPTGQVPYGDFASYFR
ncbi:hypothetical protein [Nocardia spumae]|uniref:hypothetical protein n=1 Tax=Nocardia spumae TaxID=2887190 RepID=UPI001D13EEAF|nr:hypothetical protein [Nocardia spumae]